LTANALALGPVDSNQDAGFASIRDKRSLRFL